MTKILEEKIVGKKGKKRPRRKIIEYVMQIVGCRNYNEVKRIAGNRVRWLKRTSL